MLKLRTYYVEVDRLWKREGVYEEGLEKVISLTRQVNTNTQVPNVCFELNDLHRLFACDFR